MNKYFSLFCVIAILLSAFTCFSQTGKADFKFDKKVHKFGKVKEGEIVEFKYTFTNIGNDPLIINNIKVACSCTAFEFPKYPIDPTKAAEITVSFDTKNKIGYQDRTLEIYSNSLNSPHIVRFKGTVDNK
ncbi:MAG: DUF1573 domain-containing protein [Bacteroidota bacterium]|nr:DUF1573 domain-containing protein [Bacteroidota bacterium]